MTTLEVIPARRWRHPDGRTASIFSAYPGPGWSIETVGWTWRHPDGTVGLGRPPAKTREEAEEVAQRYLENKR